MSKSTKRIMKNLTVFCKKMNGIEESTREKELFTLSFNIGAIMLNRLLSILKILNGNIFLVIIKFYMLSWSK